MEHFDPDRRSFFDWSFKALGAIGIGGVFYSIARFLGTDGIDIAAHVNPEAAQRPNIGPASGGNGNSVEIAASAVPDGSGMILTMGSAPVILVRNSNQWRAFSATCTHLGCLVKWDQAAQQFICPCHGGIYDRDGRVIAGPPPSALAEHRVAQAGNSIRISRA